MLELQTPPLSALVSLGLQSHQRGDLAGAEQRYRAILARAPKHADALHLLGVLKGQQRQHEAGLELIHEAIAENPRVSAYHNNLGNLLLKSGDLAGAEKSYRQALRVDARNADAYLNLGKMLHERGSALEARRCLKAAERLAPQSVETHMSVGRLEEGAGKREAALESYRRAARLGPGFAPAALAISSVLLTMKQEIEAEEHCRQALVLDPEYADAHYNLGNLLRGRGRLAEAAEHYRRAIELAPASASDAYNNLGLTLSDLGREKDALAILLKGAEYSPDCYDTWLTLGKQAGRTQDTASAELCLAKAITLEPGRAEAHIELGNLRLASDRREEAAACYETAIQLSPDSSAAYNNLGGALSGLELHEEAVAAYRKAVELRPDYEDAVYNLGKELSLWGDEEAGLEMLRRAIALNPTSAPAHLQVGVAMQKWGRLAESAEWYRRSVELDGALLIARSNLGMALAQLGDGEGLTLLEWAVEQQPHDPERHWVWGEKLLLHGRFEEGWREYEWRTRVPKFASQHRSYGKPRWQGEELAGRAILLYAEQGQGDTLQFSRYAALVAERGGRVVLEVQGSLQRLLAGVPGVAECVASGQRLPEFDLVAPLMSLPYLLGTRSETIPGPVSPRLVVPQSGKRLRVGIVWAGNAKDMRDRLRSTRLADWAGVAGIDGVEFVSLQTGEAAAQAREEDSPVLFVGDCSEVRDFADTAEIVAGLDLVISVDTAVAHLAGTLGKPVWILLYNLFDWRWGLEGSASAWYPTARLFRQTAPADWRPVFAEVESSLKELVGQPGR